jgi:hypothetical protein
MRSRLVENVVLSAVRFAAALSLASCSFGYQSLEEGDVRFEHCYRVDDEPRATASEKQACWATWLRNSTYGQTRDRIAYALAREQAWRATLRGVPMAASVPSAAATAHNGSPQPVNAFAPPPQMLSSSTDAGLVANRAGGNVDPDGGVR